MIAIRLADRTIIFAKEFENNENQFIVRYIKYISLEDNYKKISYLNDKEGMTIHEDAIDTWFVIHKGGK